MIGSDPRREDGPPRGVFVLATITTACFVANLYYAQSLVPYIAGDFRVSPEFAGSFVSVIQFGYGIGLFMIVPLSDVIESRRLVVTCGALLAAALVGLASAGSAAAFMVCGGLVGLFSCGAQILIPYLSRILPVETRGRALGIVSAGVLATVMLARPVALFVTAAVGWRAIYWVAAANAVFLTVTLWRWMPVQTPSVRMPYARILSSMVPALLSNRRVRRRTGQQALVFGIFTMFWTVVPIMLSQRFALPPASIGLFALVGASGVFAAPIAGRLADRGFGRQGMLSATALIVAAFLLSMVAADWTILPLVAVAAVVIDGGVQACQTFSRLIILEVDPTTRGRVNAIYMTLLYVAGAIGSIGGVFCYTRNGWTSVAAAGALLAFLVLISLVNETAGHRTHNHDPATLLNDIEPSS